MKIILLLFIVSLSIHGQSKLSREEYSVYETILNSIYYKNRRTYSSLSHFVIVSETKLDSELEPDSLFGKKYKPLIEILKQRNLSPATVERGFPFKTYHIINQKELDELFVQGKIERKQLLAEAQSKNLGVIEMGVTAWMPFYKKFPDSIGYYNLSKVAFNANKTLALAHVKEATNLTGFSRIYVVKKVRGRWKIINLGGIDSIA